MTKASARLRFIVTVLVNLSILMVALYWSLLDESPFLVQFLVISAAAVFQTFTGNTYDYLNAQIANARLRSERDQMELTSAETSIHLDELREVIAEFLEHSEIYRERVKDHLKLQEDYLCIAKSSEGLSDVFNALVKKVRMPFATTLMKIPGTVKPFERMGMFLVPVASLPGINERNIQTYISRKIIPEVQKERRRFLRRPRTDPNVRPEKFSYKYVAFLLRKGSISYEVENRKFNREFNAFVVNGQSGINYRRVKSELTRFVKTRDLLALVNWASFADLNRDQKKLVEKNKVRMSDALNRHEIGTLKNVADSSPEELFEILWPVLRRKTTERKAKNILTKVIEGAQNTVGVLERNGISS